MDTNKKYYYIVTLEVVLKGTDFVFGFINISHIPYSKLLELFKDQVTYEKFLFDDSLGYIIDEELYNRNKEYLDNEIPFTFDFKLFDYSVGLGSIEVENHRKDYHEHLPPFFENSL